jgi:hypothetical protein
MPPVAAPLGVDAPLEPPGLVPVSETAACVPDPPPLPLLSGAVEKEHPKVAPAARQKIGVRNLDPLALIRPILPALGALDER